MSQALAGTPALLGERVPPRPARVLLLAKGLGRGGAEQLLVNGLAHVDRQRFDVEVAYVLPWKDALVPQVVARGIPVHCLGDGPGGRHAWPARLRRLLGRGRFDLVHTHMAVPAVVARLPGGRQRPALVHTEHNVWPRLRRPTYWANALTYHRNDAVLAVSEGVAESIVAPPLARRLGMPPVEVLIHGIDAASIPRGPRARSRARQLLDLGADDLVVASVGNFTPKKDQAGLLEAVAELVPMHARLRLVLVGSGPLEPALRQQAAALGLGDHVVWAGSRGDVPELLAGFDVFVLSSRHEGLPIALLEALAAGLACVATTVGGIPEVVTDGVDGLLVPPAQPAALAAAVDRLLGDEPLRHSLGGRALGTAGRFQLSATVARMQDVYDAVLAARRLAH